MSSTFVLWAFASLCVLSLAQTTTTFYPTTEQPTSNPTPYPSPQPTMKLPLTTQSITTTEEVSTLPESDETGEGEQEDDEEADSDATDETDDDDYAVADQDNNDDTAQSPDDTDDADDDDGDADDDDMQQVSMDDNTGDDEEEESMENQEDEEPEAADDMDECLGLSPAECKTKQSDDGDNQCGYNVNDGQCYSVVRKVGIHGRGSFDDGYNTAQTQNQKEERSLHVAIRLIAAIVGILVSLIAIGVLVLFGKAKSNHVFCKRFRRRPPLEHEAVSSLDLEEEGNQITLDEANHFTL